MRHDRHRSFVLLHWLPVVALCLAIFVQSCYPSIELKIGFQYKDKVLHMAVYGLLAILVFRAGHVTWGNRKSVTQLLIISVVFATLYGVSDELHQFFVPTRQFDVADGVANFVGSVLGSVVYMNVAFKRGPGGASDKGNSQSG